VNDVPDRELSEVERADKYSYNAGWLPAHDPQNLTRVARQAQHQQLNVEGRK
jgi:hypothetical protein